MLQLIEYEGEIWVNEAFIVDLKKPFKSKADISKSKSVEKEFRLYSPKETLLSLKPKYTFPRSHRKSNTIFYSLDCIKRREFRSHLLYTTSEMCSMLHRSKSVAHLINHLHLENKATELIKKRLSTAINLVAKSRKFKKVITDIPQLKLLNLKTKVEVIDWNLVKPIRGDSPSRQNINNLLKTYKKIPLSVLDYEVLSSLELSHTDIQIPSTRNVSELLFITEQNHFFAGYIAKSFYESSNWVTLPLTLFGIRHRKS